MKTNKGAKIVLVAGHAPSLLNFRGPLIESLRNIGHEVIASAPDDGGPAIRLLKENGVRFEAVPLSRTQMNPLQDWRYLSALRSFFQREKPELILAYTHKPVVYSALALSRRVNQPRMYALITGLGYAFGEDVGMRRRFSRIVLSTLYRRAARRITGVMFQNPDDQALFKRHKLLAASMPQTVVRGSGVDLERFSHFPFDEADYYQPGVRTGYGPTPEKPQFLLVSRLVAGKGIREWVAAAREIKETDSGVEFHLVGPSDPNPSGISESEVREWHKAGIVIYHGATSDVRPHLRDCSAFVLPSYYGEGTPRTILEAMATGRAVITTDAPGCRETIFDAGVADSQGVRTGKNGLMVPVKSVDTLVAAMQRLIDNPELAMAMGRAGRYLAEKYYDVHKVNKQMLDFMGLLPTTQSDGECRKTEA